MRVTASVLFLLLAAAPAPAQPAPPEGEPVRKYPSGIFSHGDVGDFVEDAYGRPPEPAPGPDDATRRRGEPGLRWEGPAVRR